LSVWRNRPRQYRAELGSLLLGRLELLVVLDVVHPLSRGDTAVGEPALYRQVP